MNEAWAKTFVEGFLKMVKGFDTRDEIKSFYKANMSDISKLRSIDEDIKIQLDNTIKKVIEKLEDNNG